VAGGFLFLLSTDAAQARLLCLGRDVPGSQAARPPASHAVQPPFRRNPAISCHIGDLDCSESDDEALDRFARPLAERFLVSPIAMRIRLEKLGLLHRIVPGQRLLEKLDQLAAKPSNEKAATFFLRKS
jgi:hypothetical protein